MMMVLVGSTTPTLFYDVGCKRPNQGNAGCEPHARNGLRLTGLNKPEFLFDFAMSANPESLN
eukprot:scaffold6276_cov138-Cylindrotheca_fusiformis.AAC.2